MQFTWRSLAFGKRWAHRAKRSSPRGAAPHPIFCNELMSYFITTSCLIIKRRMGGTRGAAVILYFWIASSIARKSNRGSMTTVLPRATFARVTINPNTWNMGRRCKTTLFNPASTRSLVMIEHMAMMLRCVSTTPLLSPVVPEEKRISALSSWCNCVLQKQRQLQNFT